MLDLIKLKILDLSRLLPGSYATLILADMGAEVIKIEEPKRGDYAREFPPFIKGESVHFLNLNRNKKSVVLDLKTPQGQKACHEMAAEADIIIESFRPGVCKRLNISYTDLKKINPKIIYASISGYGQTGPYKDSPGHDINYIALAGLLGITGTQDTPVIPGIPIADIAGAFFTVIAILSAVINRNITGKGRYIDISLADSALHAMSPVLGQYFIDKKTPKRSKGFLTGGFPCYGVYKTKDNKFLALGALESKFWINFCQAIERTDLIEYQFFDKAIKELNKIFKTKTQKEWIDIFKDKEVCITPVKNLKEIENDAHFKQREMFIEIEHPLAGVLKQIGLPIKFSDITHGQDFHPPCLGEHTIIRRFCR